ncbi:MAG: hypothetical protein AAF677_06290 [Pseudomonadota bacterium]
MLFLEILSFVLMLAALYQAARYTLRWKRELLLVTLIYVTVAAMLGFAAFGGDSGLITDWQTMLTRALGGAAIAAVVGGYFWLLRRARRQAADKAPE